MYRSRNLQALSLASLLLLGMVDGWADELARVRKRAEAVESAMETLRSEKNAVVEQLAGIEQQYGILANSMRELQGETRKYERRLGELDGRRRVLREGMSRQNRLLIGQARAAYATGRQEWLKLALNQEDPARFSRMLIYYGYLDRARAARLASLRRDLEAVLALEAQASAEAARLEEVRERTKGQQLRLEQARRQRRTILAGVERSLADESSKLARLHEDERRLEGVVSTVTRIVEEIPIARPEVAAVPPGRAKPGWPVQGEILQSFGAPRMSGRWDGVLIGAREGTPVRAVTSGRVVFADWLRGYGLLAIVEHGDGFMSLYAFAQSLQKNSGDWVEAGDVIASVGMSGGQSEPGLYFGVRERGRPIDPIAWCQRAN